MSIEKSIYLVHNLQIMYQGKIDFIFSYIENHEIKTITYDSATRMLSEPFPDNVMLNVLPNFYGGPLQIFTKNDLTNSTPNTFADRATIIHN